MKIPCECFHAILNSDLIWRLLSLYLKGQYLLNMRRLRLWIFSKYGSVINILVTANIAVCMWVGEMKSFQTTHL